MSDPTISLTDLKRQVDPHLVEMMEMLLDDARKGELQGVIVAGTNDRGEVYCANSGNKFSLYAMVGAIFSVGLESILQRDERVREIIRECARDDRP